MANIIALCGVSKTGKTTVLNSVISAVRSGNHKEIESKKHGTDEVAVLEINGKTVGITTRGDTEGVLEEDFGDMRECDVYVCACRTQGGTQNFLRDREKEQQDSVVFFHTWEEEESQRSKRNAKKKKSIIDAIMHFCK